MTHINESTRLPQDWDAGVMARVFKKFEDAIHLLSGDIVVTKTADFSIAPGVTRIVCNGAGTITVTLPSAVTYKGSPIHIRTIAAQTVVSAASNVIPLAGGAAGTAILAATAGKWATLVTNGTNWAIDQAG